MYSVLTSLLHVTDVEPQCTVMSNNKKFDEKSVIIHILFHHNSKNLVITVEQLLDYLNQKWIKNTDNEIKNKNKLRKTEDKSGLYNDNDALILFLHNLNNRK